MSDPRDFRTDPARMGLTRRDLLRVLAAAPLAAGFPEAANAQEVEMQLAARAKADPIEAKAGRWKPWLVPSVSIFQPSAPPSKTSSSTKRELAELQLLQSERNDRDRALVAFWDTQGGVPAWTQILLDKIQENRTNPVMAARAIALVQTAMADATIAAWQAKFKFNRAQPVSLNKKLKPLSKVEAKLPSYPSEHAAVSAAACEVLNYLYPNQKAKIHGEELTFAQAAEECAFSRMLALTNYRTDVTAGLHMGQRVAAQAIARGRGDGSDAVWDAAGQPGRLVGPQHWIPTAPANTFPPLQPLAGTWQPWLLDSPSQFRAQPPPALQASFPSPAFLEEAAMVKATVDNLTAEQIQIASFWADDPGATSTPPGHWTQIALGQVVAAKLTAPRAARAMALVGVGLADSAIACWDNKYAFWVMRPITAIRTMSDQPFYDPNFVTPITTPPFPAYTSGHSTFSGCTATVLEHLFPKGKAVDAFGRKVSFAEAAEQAALSRLYGGIHYPSDNDEGLKCGGHIAEVVIERAQSDGAG